MRRWIPLLVAALLLAGCAKKEEEEKPKPVVAVKTEKAEMAAVRLSVSAPATIWPREQANISSRLTAQIRELRVRKGDDIKAGQVLAVLESRDLIAQRQEASAAVNDATLNLQKTTSGTLPADIERARGQAATAKAALDLAQKVFDRRSELFQQGAIPERELLQSQTELAQAKTNSEVAEKSLELLRKQSGEKDIAMAKSRVEQAKARLAQSSAQVEFTELRSSFAGTVTDQLQFPGDMAQPGAPLFTVMDLAVVNARAQVPEAQMAGVHTGQACRFAPSDPEPGPRDGRVTVINKAVDAARRTVEVWCEIPNSGSKLRANVFGNVQIFTGTSSGVVAPLAAVQFAEGSRSGAVMVVDQKNIAHKRDIEAGETFDGRVQILKGLNAGEVVVTEGGYGLPDGAQVRVGEPAK
jgi:multidrug efflux pump subunit AcrA (membrane-fusion protein)